MIHLIIGGSGSGKSAYAERQLAQCAGEAHLVYVATMIPYGRETKEKIQRHRRQRAALGFETIECYQDLNDIKIPENNGVLLECISNLTANEFYREDCGQECNFKRAFTAVTEGIRSLERQTKYLVVVTNDVHGDRNGYSAETEQYRELLGKINCELARMAEQVTEVVCGIPIHIKEQR